MKEVSVIVLCALLSVAACQPAPAPAETTAQAPAPAAPAAPEQGPLPDDDAEIPANWIEADGPGASSVSVEDGGQKVTLECSRRDSAAASAPGRLAVYATWPADQSPPRAQDVALILAGAGFREAPIWSRDGGRDTVSIQLPPTPDLLSALKASAGLRVMAGDWFIAVAADAKGVVKRFAAACEVYAKP